jgi:hypothetical protein
VDEAAAEQAVARAGRVAEPDPRQPSVPDLVSQDLEAVVLQVGIDRVHVDDALQAAALPHSVPRSDL